VRTSILIAPEDFAQKEPYTHKDSSTVELIGVGTDITECHRIEKMIEKHGDQFLERVYTDVEREYCGIKKQAILHYTGRWAAKEAALKAIGTGWIRGITWRDAEVVNAPSGKPSLRLSGGAAEHAERLGIQQMQLSISHCQSHAVAFVVAVGQRPDD
jgi:holo-[acyl-carrier protein] synthase